MVPLVFLVWLWLGARLAGGYREVISLDKKEKKQATQAAPFNPGDQVYFKGAPWEDRDRSKLLVRYGDLGVVKRLRNTQHDECEWNFGGEEDPGADVTFAATGATVCVPFKLMSGDDQRYVQSPSRANAASFAAAVGLDVFIISKKLWAGDSAARRAGKNYLYYRCQIVGPAFDDDLDPYWTKKLSVSIWCPHMDHPKLRNVEIDKDVSWTSKLNDRFPTVTFGDYIYYQGRRTPMGEQPLVCKVQSTGEEYPAQVGERFLVRFDTQHNKLQMRVCKTPGELESDDYIFCRVELLIPEAFFEDKNGRGLAPGDPVKYMGSAATLVKVGDDTLTDLRWGDLKPRPQRKMIVKLKNGGIQLNTGPENVEKA